MKAATLIDRLVVANPGWDEWNQLIELVNSLDFEYVTSDYLGNFFSARGWRLSFSELGDKTCDLGNVRC